MAAETAVATTEEAQLVQSLIARSRAAQAQIADYSQEQVDELITAMVWSVARQDVAEKIAKFTVEETQLGNYDGKFLKIFKKTRAALFDIINDKSVGILEEDKDMIEDLIISAVNNAMSKAQEESQNRMNSVTGGIMGGMKIPGM